MKRLGPDLKMPNLKGLKEGKGLRGLEPPAALANVYYDLRDRRLLPLVALVVVAIVAVPFLLGGDPEERVPVPADGAGTALEEGASPGATLTVVEASPGLRDYRKRLRGRTPTDPFKQRYVGVPEEARLESSLSSAPPSGEGASSSLSEAPATGDGASAAVEIDPEGGSGGSGVDPEPGGSGGSGKPGGSEPSNGGVRLIEFRFDIQISRTEPVGDGDQRWSTPQVRRQVPSLTQLPGQRTVATVSGVNLQTGKIFFLVSDDVKSLDGEFVCTTRTAGGLCELLELEVGSLLELVSAPNDVRYRIKVLRVDTVEAGKPRVPKGSLPGGSTGPAAQFLPRP